MFGDTTLFSSGFTDMFIVKVDSTGNFEWVQQTGGTGEDWGSAITADVLSNLYITGAFDNLVTFGNDTLNSLEGTIDIFVAKLSVCPILSTNIKSKNISCYSSGDGEAFVLSCGGFPPFNYLWSDGQITLIADSLSAGIYTVVVTDSTGFSVTDSVLITEPQLLTTSISQTDVSCNGGNNGFAIVTTTGGIGNYTYLWSNGQTTDTATGLSAGTYSVIVTDSNGCKVTDSIIIIEPPLLMANTILINNASCNNICDGQALVSYTGGTPPYIIVWNDSLTFTDTVVDLCAGVHSVIIYDSNSCSAIDSITITEPVALSITPTITESTCNGLCDGSVIFNISGGTPPYTILGGWNNLCAGNYVVTVTDSQGCTISDSIIIAEPDSIFIASIVNAATQSNNDGTIDLTVTGGTPPYTFSWNNGAASEDIDSLFAGIYQVVVTDSLGCIDSLTIEIPNLTGLSDINLQNRIKIYPNPFSKETTIILSSLYKEKISVSLFLYDIMGRKQNISYLLENNNKIKLFRGVLFEGIYFFTISNQYDLLARGKLVVKD